MEWDWQWERFGFLSLFYCCLELLHWPNTFSPAHADSVLRPNQGCRAHIAAIKPHLGGLAFGTITRYFAFMSQRLRRLIGLVLVLTLAVGGALQSVQASDMAVKMSTAAVSDMTMPGGCSGCSGDNDGTPMVCFAICNAGFSAVLSSNTIFVATDRTAPVATSPSRITGLHGPPDPYPPRPTSLS